MFCFVAGGEHDTAPDDHRAVAQCRRITLLDGGVERVQIGMQDAGCPGHEPMFAPGSDSRIGLICPTGG
ncbi:Uncharacterised protein [Mycobacteroides abscessus subsp. abscessus]|nr:Uncharacterised protein [Mycobacteroides abscessus subsp. abscessus]